MATNMKRFTISVTDEMEVKLNHVKKELYYNTSKSKMMKDLINLGLDSMQKKIEKEKRKKKGGEDFLE